MGEALSKEEKLRVIKALEEDIEFRYAVAGALGILEILKRLDAIESRLEENSRKIESATKRLEEHSRKLEELTKRVEEHSRILQEHSRILQEHSRKLEEHSRKLEELTKRVEEHSRILQEHSRILQEHSRVLQEHSKRLEELTRIVEVLVHKIGEHSEKIEGLRKEVSSLTMVVGALTESVYAKYVYEDIEREVLARGERVVRRVRNARVDDVDIDLLVETSKCVYVVEVKVRPSYEDVGRLIAKVDIARTHYPEKNIVGIIAGAMIGREVESYAKGKGISAYTY